MKILDKIDELFEASRTSRFKDMKALKSALDELDELRDALKMEIDARSTFTDIERLTFLEHYTVRAMRNVKALEPKLKAFQSSLKAKIDFVKKG